jgi:hypothetical protein
MELEELAEPDRLANDDAEVLMLPEPEPVWVDAYEF